MEHERAIELIERRIKNAEDEIEYLEPMARDLERQVKNIKEKVYYFEITKKELTHTLKTLKGE